VGGLPSIQADVNGTPMSLVVDTGADFGMVNKTAASLLNLTAAPGGHRGRVAGQTLISDWVHAESLVVPGLPARSIDFAVMPAGMTGTAPFGTLGMDWLSGYDIDLDASARKLALYSAGACTSPPWPETPVVKTAMLEGANRKIMVGVNLDGTDLKAVVDTGAEKSVLDAEAAERVFGLAVADSSQGSDVPHSVNGEPRAVSSHQFNVLRIESIGINHPSIQLMSFGSQGNGPQMILAIDILRQLHLYIAQSRGTVYLASTH